MNDEREMARGGGEERRRRRGDGLLGLGLLAGCAR
jgi:hypothetical protein